MGVSDLIKFTSGSQDKGINVFDPDISADITWDEDNTVNVSGGIRRGVGVRYGMAPLGGHSNTEVPTGSATNGIQRSEITSGAVGLTFRSSIFGIVPVTMAIYSGAYPKANRQFYVYLVGLDNTVPIISLDACISATLNSTVNESASSFTAGLAVSSYRQESPLVRRHKTELLNLPQATTPTATNMKTILSGITSRYWMPSAHISVSGKRIPYQWMLGTVTVDPDATHTPALSIWTSSSVAGTAPTIYCGAPSEIVTRENTENNSRLFSVYCLDSSLYKIDIQYFGTITNADTLSKVEYSSGTMYSAVTATKTGASTSYSSVKAAIVNDPGSFTNSRHDAVLFAGEIPLAAVYQDWLKAANGMMPQWVDLSSPGCIPRNGLSLDLFSNKPSGFVGSSESYGISQVGEDTGFLQLDATYDIGFSYYNKRLDYETNVIFGGQRTIATTDFESLSVAGPFGGGIDNLFEHFETTSLARNVPWEYSDSTAKTSTESGRGLSLNDYEIRFYYRNTGTTEWFPAGFFDAALLWFGYAWPTVGSVAAPIICRAPIGGLPGGQPNGFIDYSPLPKQRYICTTVFQQRAFWWSEKSMHFSNTNNIYAYPTGNITACSTGKWRGGIVHVRTNIAGQASRLVVFGDTAFVARFTGERTIQNVRISSDTVGQFEVDGSDFRMDYLCDSTAFSFRSAVVANGILYWWGPQGVYRDDGISEPKKISGGLEPTIFSYIDMARDNEVHCVYNKRTSEILWFYPPKVADSTYPTYGLAYNIENEEFYPFKMRCQVDSSQNIKLENDDTPDNVDGERILLHCRASTAATTQRTFYFDDLVLAGEQGPTREASIISFTTPTTGTRRLVLAGGSVGITAGGYAVNDLISVQNAKGYAPSLTLATDMIAKVTAINNASSYMDILLPTGASWDASATLTGQTAFPIYQMHPTTAGLHGITWSFLTNYWLPNGISEAYYWQYLYFLFRYLGIPTPTNAFTGLPQGEQLTLTYGSLVCRAALTDTLSLKNNSSGNCQIHHPLRNEGRAANGQALKYGLSGIHIGNPWTLEYMEAHCLKEQGFTLKEFEG